MGIEYEASKAIADSLISLSLGYDVAFHNGSEYSSPADTYLYVTPILNGSLNYATGTEAKRCQGIMQVSVRTPLYSGWSGMDIASQVKSHFVKGRTLWGSGVRVDIQDDPDLAGPFLNEAATRNEVVVSINFEAEEV